MSDYEREEYITNIYLHNIDVIDGLVEARFKELWEFIHSHEVHSNNFNDILHDFAMTTEYRNFIINNGLEYE